MRVERRDRIRNNTEQEKRDCWRRANEEWRKQWGLDREEGGEYKTGICHYPSWYFGISASPSLSPCVHHDLNHRNHHNLKEQTLLSMVLLPPPFALVFVLINQVGRYHSQSKQKPQLWANVAHPHSKEQSCDPFAAASWTPAPAMGRTWWHEAPFSIPLGRPFSCLNSPLLAHIFLHILFQLTLAKRSVNKIHYSVENVAWSYSCLIFLHKEPDTFKIYYPSTINLTEIYFWSSMIWNLTGKYEICYTNIWSALKFHS